MGKHSKEKEKKKINLKKQSLVVLLVIILVFVINFMLSNKNIVIEEQKDISRKTSKTIDSKKLVIKSKTEFNRIIEYTFENDILKTVKMYEQFENKEEFEIQKKNYEIVDNVVIININEQELSIEIEKQDFGSDAAMSYEQIYDKYLVQIVGAYEVVKDEN